MDPARDIPHGGAPKRLTAACMNLAGFPYTGHLQTINGLQMHYLDEGPAGGEPVVMIHGNPTWSYLFRKPVQALSERFRCIVPDHIGMGFSSRPGEDEYGFSLQDRITDLEALLDLLEIHTEITLIMHDWGGMIGMGYACRHPDRIKRLVLMNTAAFHMPAGLSLPWQLKAARSGLPGAVLVQGLNAFCHGALKQGVVRRPLPPEIRQAYLAPYDTWYNRLAVLRFVQDIPLQPADPAYPAVTAVEQGLAAFRNRPVLICWGMQDFVFTEPFLDEWRRRLPRAEISRFHDAGHLLLEDAADEVILRIRQFLDPGR